MTFKIKISLVLLCLNCVISRLSASPVMMDKTEYERLKAKTDVYLNKVSEQPDWLYSRLQMYWKSHATDVYVRDESFSHAGGDRAPVPTVKFNGMRNHVAPYGAPKIEDVVPFDDDEQSNVTFVNKADGRQEKVHPSKTGNAIASLNRQILGIARDAARLYAENGDKRYAQMALDIFDVFMKGIYYRHVPIDLNHGHIQTLVGMTTFEVIHEDVINECTETYRLLCDARFPMKDASLYEAALKKWAENIIANGVPHNNWDLIQARFLVRIALALRSDGKYDDRKGREYYLDYVVHKSSIRQWSMKELAHYGFDPMTDIWCESPGYSTGVVGDFIAFAHTMDTEAGIDMLGELPVIARAAFAQTQYLFPNRMICGFGDTHPGYIRQQPLQLLKDYATRHHDQSLASRVEALMEAVKPDAPASAIEKFVTPTFYSSNVSWLVQRTGMDQRHDLMVSLNSSLGNHQHANGISMELYGKGLVLAPDAGIGRALYGGSDYQEYYSRFPAHNTVCVDGVSDYPVMMSQHSFKVDFLHHTEGATVSQVSFIEPETQSDQVRTNGIVKTTHGGYYVDIFRSRRKDGKDKFHDYFYHNLGQQMTLTAADGSDLGLKPTDELAFAGGHLYAYSYIYDKLSVRTQKDVSATFSTLFPNGRQIDMRMWMQGTPDRDVFRVLSPVNMEYERLGDLIPYKVDEQPVLTFVARQYGDAWSHPFVAVYEPSDTDEPTEIASVEFFTPSEKDAVGIKVHLKDGRVDTIVSTPQHYEVKSNGKTIIRQ